MRNNSPNCGTSWQETHQSAFTGISGEVRPIRLLRAKVGRGMVRKHSAPSLSYDTSTRPWFCRCEHPFQRGIVSRRPPLSCHVRPRCSPRFHTGSPSGDALVPIPNPNPRRHRPLGQSGSGFGRPKWKFFGLSGFPPASPQRSTPERGLPDHESREGSPT